MIFINIHDWADLFKAANKHPERPDFIHSNWTSDTKVFLSTSHSAQHKRDGVIKSKNGEVYVAILADALQNIINEKTGKHTVGTFFKTNNPEDDPNSSVDSPYRNAFNSLISGRSGIVFDLHIMNHKRPHDIDLGTHNHSNVKNDVHLTNAIKDRFMDRNFDARIDHLFSAHKELNFSKQVHLNNPNIKAIQVEINSRLFSTQASYEALLNTFAEIIEQILIGHH